LASAGSTHSESWSRIAPKRFRRRQTASRRRLGSRGRRDERIIHDARGMIAT
jgi:hypothetical protein